MLIEFRKSNKFAIGVEDEATCVLKLNVSPGNGGGGGEMDKEFIICLYTLFILHLSRKVRFGSWVTDF